MGRRLNLAAREAGMEYWRVDRVARFLDVSKKRVYQLVQERRLEAVRLGPRQMRVTRASLDDYLRDLHRRAQEELDF
jgi:excisionase family DNA binding protein